MPFRIIRNDLTKVSADAIVNTANPMPSIGRGTDSAVYEAAGRDRLLEARAAVGEIKPGEAAYTPAFDLDARYIIHTVGPAWMGGDHGELETLGSCYRKSLLLANYLGCRSIAFPMISSGSYGMPKDRALKVAFDEISDFLMVSEMDITLVVFDRSSFELSEGLLADVRQFIDDNYVEEQSAKEYSQERYSNAIPRLDRSKYMVSDGERRPGLSERADSLEQPESVKQPEEDEMMPLASEAEEAVFEDVDLESEEEFDAYFHSLYEESISTSGSTDLSMPAQRSEPLSGRYSKGILAPSAGRTVYSSDGSAMSQPRSLEEAMEGLGQTFQQKLLGLIDEKGFTDTQVYKKANMDRKLFSKIRCNENYKPSKNTVLALAISLELNLDETTDLLRRAGLALQPSSKADLIVRYCISRHIYDIFEVNSLLFEYDQQLLG